MSLTSKFLAATTAMTLIAGAASANEVYFYQVDEGGGTAVGIGTLVIDQDNTGNSIGMSTADAEIYGALGSVTIKQLGATSTGNTADFKIYGDDASTTGTLTAQFTGSTNDWDLIIGTSTDAAIARYVNPKYSLIVTGDSNVINDNFANAAPLTSTFEYRGTITGSSNAVSSTSGSGVGSVKVIYVISGDSNTANTDLSTASGSRTAEFYITGNSNNLTINAQSATDSIANATIYGDNVGMTIGQTGTLSYTNMNVSHLGTNPLTVTTSATGTNQYAEVWVEAANGGSFTLNQASDNATYIAEHQIAAGGSVTVNQ